METIRKPLETWFCSPAFWSLKLSLAKLSFKASVFSEGSCIPHLNLHLVAFENSLQVPKPAKEALDFEEKDIKWRTVQLKTSHRLQPNTCCWCCKLLQSSCFLLLRSQGNQDKVEFPGMQLCLSRSAESMFSWILETRDLLDSFRSLEVGWVLRHVCRLSPAL